jgi:hypothetical protein
MRTDRAFVLKSEPAVEPKPVLDPEVEQMPGTRRSAIHHGDDASDGDSTGTCSQGCE